MSLLNAIGVKAALKLLITIGKLLPSLKDPLISNEKSCLVYWFTGKIVGLRKLDRPNEIINHKYLNITELSNTNVLINRLFVNIPYL